MLPDNLKLAAELAARIKNHENRIERLESLEHANEAFLPSIAGCIDFLDYTMSAGGVASITVDVPPNPYPVGDYGWTHLTGWYYAEAGSPGVRTLHMRINAIATNYGYTYKYSAASAGPTVVSADLQTSYIIARLLGSYRTTGWFQIPFYSMPMHLNCWGDYVAYDGGAAIGSQVEAGEFKGVNTGGVAVVTSITLFASAGNVAAGAFLYGWCPRWVAGSGPPD